MVTVNLGGGTFLDTESQGAKTKQDKNHGKTVYEQGNSADLKNSSKLKTNSNLSFVVVRDPSSLATENGKNVEDRGKDVLSVRNNNTGAIATIPITSVPTMAGTSSEDAVAPGTVALTLGPSSGSKFSPNVMTIAGGVTLGGNTLRSDGTTSTNAVPWRGHETKLFGSEGCFVGQTGNSLGSYATLLPQLQSWGLEYGESIIGSVIQR